MQQNLPNKIKELGQVFTPAFIVEYIVENTIGPYLNRVENDLKDDLAILDPAVGEGIFLISALEYLETYWKQKSKEELISHLYGIDLDPSKVQMCRELLGHPFTMKTIKSFNALDIIPNSGTEGQGSSLMNWKINFPKTRGKFQVIFGNPPWGADLSTFKSKLTYLKTATSQMDSWSLFLERSIMGLHENGFLGFVVPNTLLSNPNYMKIRQIILEECQITHLVNLGEDIFPKVTQPSMIIILKKTKSNSEHLVRVISKISKTERIDLIEERIKLDEVHFYQCKQSRFLKNPQLEFDIFAGVSTDFIQAVENDLHNEQKQVTTLGTLVFNGRGVEIGKKGRVLQCPNCGKWNPPPRLKRKCTNPTCEQLVSPTDPHSEIVTDSQQNPKIDRPFLAGYQVQRYFTHEHRYINTDCQGINYKTPELYQSPKLLVRKTGNKMNWVIDFDNRWVSQVVYIFQMKKKIPSEYKNISLEYLLGVLNSKLMMRYIQSKFFDPNRTDFPHFVQNSILNLPIRIPHDQGELTSVITIGKLALKLQKTYQDLYSCSSDSYEVEKKKNTIREWEDELEMNLESLYSIPKDINYL